jgi:hypothetical protein
MLSMKDFALHDAMMAIEVRLALWRRTWIERPLTPQVMDSRMDSGMDIPEYTIASKNFNPMRPLLPEEVCWILDRLTAAEVRNGRSLNAAP